MAKKKKPKSPQSQPSAPTARPITVARVPASDEFDIAEIWQHPVLFLAAVSAAFAILSAILAVQYQNNMTMGALGETTGMILWAAIACTLFASYWRTRTRERSKTRV